MNLRTLLAALCFILCFGQAFAAPTISVDGIEPLTGTDSVIAGSVLKFHLRYTNDTDSGFNITNAFVISSPEGATWTDSAAGNFRGANLGPIGIDTTGLLTKALFPTLYQLRTFSSAGAIAKADGLSPDTVSFSAAAAEVDMGLTPHFDNRVFTIRLKTKLADAGKTICIDSSMRFPPTNVWKWAALYPTTGTVIPAWGGQRCIRLFDPNPPKTLQVSPTTLNFSAQEGDPNPATQPFSVTEGTGTAVAYASSATAPWIALTNPNGTTPGNVTVGVNIAGKTAGTYTDSVQVTSALVSNSPRWVKVILTLTPRPKVLVVDPTTLNFVATEGGANPATQWFDVTEQGGAAIGYSSATDASWINLVDPNGTTADSVGVNVNIVGKTAGTYTDSILVVAGAATNPEIWVKVNLTVNASPKTLVVAPTTLNFFAAEGGANPATQWFDVSEAGGAAISFTSSESAAWISLVDPTSTTPDSVGVNIDVAGKTAGTYTDSVLVNAASATNPNVWVKVNLTIEASAKVLVVAPTLLNFEATEGGANPAGQTFDVSEAGAQVIGFSATETASWISLLNASGNTPGTVTVNVDITGVTPGMYTDSIQVTAAEAGNSPLWVKVHLMLNASPKVLVVAPDSLHFAVTASNPIGVAQTFDVTEEGGAAIPYAASETASWINLTDPSGTTPGTVSVNVDATGLGVGLHTDTITVVGDATNSPRKVVVTVDVSACPVLVANKTTFEIAGLVGDTISFIDSVLLTSSGSSLTFEAQAADHFAFHPGAGTTPGMVRFAFSNSYGTAGEYDACFTIVTTGEPAAGCSGSQVQVCVHVTVTEPPKYLAVEPATLNFTAMLGGSNPTPQIFMVSEQGGATIAYKLAETASWFSLNKAFGNTPDSVVVSVDITGLAPGTYTDSVNVNSDAVVNSPQWVKVNLTVSECPILALNKTAVYDTIYSGDTYVLTDSLLLTSTGPEELFWHAVHDTLFVLSADNGQTPSTVGFTFTAQPTGLGMYQYCVDFVTDEPVAKAAQVCNSQVSYCVNLLVLKAASADTLIVVNTPAVPGARVVVPVNFKNDCNLLSAAFGLTFDAANLYLDSVSFVGSRVAGFGQLNVSINNTTGTAGLDLAAGASDAAAPGFGLLADLHFTVRPEAPETTYPLVLIDTVVFGRNCGQGLVLEQPEFIPGNIIVATETNFVCGYVVDPEGNEIPGATVLLYANWPNGSPLASTTSSGIGSWAFSDFTSIPFDVYAYKTGYYPGWVENLNYGDKGVKIVLTPVKTFTATSQWVDYYCNENTLYGAPLPVGSVVEAYTGALLVGQFMVTEAGKYGFMPVYRANSQVSDDGAHTGEVITFTINGIQAIPTTVYPADYAQVNLCLEAGEEITKSCTLEEGWNLVSWNVNTASDNIETVLAPYLSCIDVVLGFEQGGLTYDPELEDFSTLWSVDHMSGYWIKVKAGCSVTLELTGTSVPVSTPIPVYPGWNLVSYLPEVPLAPAVGFASLGSLQFAYGWDDGIKIYSPGAGGFNDLTLLNPCNGYWVKVGEGDNLVYPGGEPGVAPRYVVQNSNIAANGVTPTTAWVNLYASNLKVDGNTIPAGATITAHAVATGAKVGSFEMTREGKFGFMPVYADASSDLKPGETFYIAVNGVATQEEFTWTTNGDRVEVGALSTAAGSGTLPSSFSLGQNYPNPFNPSTTISFSVPVTGNAKIEVYNVLGALVAVPFDGEATAGTNSVVWDGKDLNGQSVASGIYMYRLTSGAASETRKMMLLK